MCRVTREGKIKNKYIRNSVGVTLIVDEIQENRRFGRVLRREETEALRLVNEMYVEGRRGRGRPKKRWSDTIESDMKS